MATEKTKKLTPEKFDAALDAPAGQRLIWTVPAIARRIGRGDEFVKKKFAKMPGTPMKKIGGRWCVGESDLMDFLRSPPVSTPK